VRRVRTQTSRADRNTRVVAVEIFGRGAAPFVVGADEEDIWFVDRQNSHLLAIIALKVYFQKFCINSVKIILLHYIKLFVFFINNFFKLVYFFIFNEFFF